MAESVAAMIERHTRETEGLRAQNPAGAVLRQHAIGQTEELLAKAKALESENGRLRGLLVECLEFLDSYADVNDGPYGEPTPNKAMSLITNIEVELKGWPI